MWFDNFHVLQVYEKKYEVIGAWKCSIINHLWWCAESCEGSGELLIEKFTLILYHITNQHSWENDSTKKIFKKCAHGEFTAEKIQTTKWIQKTSPEYIILNKIITDKTFLKDLDRIKNYCHTGSLESYHNKRLKYMPKRLHFSYYSMLYRSEIAVLDHNFNANSERQVMHSYWNFSKSTKQWVKKNVYVHYDDWRMHLVDTVVLYVKGEITIPAFRDSLRFPLDIPDNIYDIPKPEGDSAEANFSRFSKE
jgi:hypothetical protein